MTSTFVLRMALTLSIGNRRVEADLGYTFATSLAAWTSQPAIYDEHLQRVDDVGVLTEVGVRRSRGTLEEMYLEMRLDDASLCVCMGERERERKQGV